MRTASDAELVLAAGTDNKQAFGALADRHTDQARRLAMRMVGNAEVAGELVQEALLQAYLGLSTLREPASFTPWLLGIVRNLCRTYLRSQRSGWHTLDLEAVDTFVANDEADPALLVERWEEDQLVQAAIGALSPKNQAATWLFYMEALSVEEIAQTLAASPNAVKGRLFQARKQLHTQLKPFFAPLLGATNGQSVIDQREQKMTKISTVKILQNASDNQILYLLDTAGLRYLRLWIGPHEAEQIRLQLAGKASARPLTYRYFADFLAAMAIQLEAVRVARLHENTFYAISQFRNGELVKELDARPSDAIGLALHTGSPIFVDDELMAQSGEPLPDPLDVDAWFAAEVARVQEERQIIAAWQAEFYNTIGSRFTPQAQAVLQKAMALVQHFRLNYLGTEHLLWGLVAGQNSGAAALLYNANVTKVTLTQAILARTGPLPQIDEQGELITSGDEPATAMPPLMPRVIDVLKIADTLRENAKATQIATEHLLLSILREGGGMAVTLLQDLGVDLDGLARQLLET